MKLFRLGLILVFLGNLLPLKAAEQTLEQRLLALQKIEIIDKPALMIGMGLTQLMSDDYYIGAFYLDEVVQYDGSNEFLYVEVARRMEFRIASSSSVSARSFSRKLAEAIRINNDRDDVSRLKTEVGRLLKMFKGTYQKGDVLQFDYHTNFGTRVILNGQILGEIPRSNELYKLLINIWVGERPPSSKFKEGILGNNDGAYAISLLRKFIDL